MTNSNTNANPKIQLAPAGYGRQIANRWQLIRAALVQEERRLSGPEAIRLLAQRDHWFARELGC